MSDDRPRITEQTYDICCEPDDIVPPELGGGTVQQMAERVRNLEVDRDIWQRLQGETAKERDTARREAERLRHHVLSLYCELQAPSKGGMSCAPNELDHITPSVRAYLRRTLRVALDGAPDPSEQDCRREAERWRELLREAMRFIETEGTDGMYSEDVEMLHSLQRQALLGALDPE